MQTYRLEWNLCQINGVSNFTYTSYEAHMQSLISPENGFQWFYEKIRSIDGKVKFNQIDSKYSNVFFM